MPRSVTQVDVLQEYISGVMTRAEHHAKGVDEIILAIAGAVVWRKDNTDIRVMEREGEMKNVLWVQIGGRRYILAYNHNVGEVEVRDGSTHGIVLASFSNETSMAEVKMFFSSL